MSQTSLAAGAAADAPARPAESITGLEGPRAVRPDRGRAFWLRPSLFVAFVTASLSGVVILLHALHWVTLMYTIRVLAPLTAFVSIALLVHRRHGPEDVFLNRLVGGLLAGVGGLVAYDLLRLALLFGHLPFNPFRPIEVYGLLILGRYQDTALTKTVGWAFHVWNGLAFALMYTMAFGRGRMLWALGWAMILEVAMLASYPSLFGIVRNGTFVGVSLTGHLAYGLGLGATARQVVKS